MKSRFAHILSSAALCLLLSSAAHAVLVVADPPVDRGGPNVLNGTVPRVDNGDILCYTITNADILNGAIYFQFESNENDASIDLRLAFYSDMTPDGSIVGDTLFYDYDIAPGNLTIEGLKTLTALTNQTTFEWAISGLAGFEGYEICVDVDISGQSNGFERAQFAQVSITAVPETSAFLFGSLISGGLGFAKLKRRS